MNAYSSVYELRENEVALNDRLAAETTALFKRPMDATQTRRRIQRQEREESSPVPVTTAYDLLLEINSRLPVADNVQMNITEIDIKTDVLNTSLS